MNKTILAIVTILFITAAALTYVFVLPKLTPPTITTYEECIEAPDSQIQESYPQVCVTASGEQFVQPITETLPVLPGEDNTLLPPSDDTTGSAIANNGCLISGCNNEICAEEEMMSPCIFKEEFACYRQATCERQADGACGWTPTEALTSCLKANAGSDSSDNLIF
jgi:hypothetical protein